MKNDNKAIIILVAVLIVVVVILGVILAVKFCTGDKKDDTIKLNPVQKQELPKTTEKTDENVTPKETEKPIETEAPKVMETPNANVPDSNNAPYDKGEKIQNCMDGMKKALIDAGFDYVDVNYVSDDHCVQVSIAVNGVADATQKAFDNGMVPESWNEMIVRLKDLSKQYGDLLESHNLSDLHIRIDFLNDKLLDHSLIIVIDGVVTYNVFDN